MTLPTEFVHNQFLIYGMGKLCAICSMKLEPDQRHQLFATIISDIDMAISAFQALESFSKFNIANGPQHLCTTCFHKTIATYKFIVLCNRAQDHLENYLTHSEGLEEIQKLKANVKVEQVHISETEVLVENRVPQYEQILLEEDPIKLEVDELNSNDICSASDSEICGPAEQIEIKARDSVNMVPEKSREKYEYVYQRFMDWRVENEADSFSESVMLTYFKETSLTKKPSTLWALYSMLRTTIIVKHNINIANYSNLLSFLRVQAKGFQRRQSKTLSAKDIKDFLQDAPDRTYLFMKVVLIIGLSGGCSKQELRLIKLENVEDSGKLIIVTIPASISRPSRCFLVADDSNYAICKKYINLRPRFVKGDKDLPFFVHYINGKCTKQCVGVNTFGTICKRIAEFLGLPDAKQYTGHCFKRSAATIGLVKLWS